MHALVASPQLKYSNCHNAISPISTPQYFLGFIKKTDTGTVDMIATRKTHSASFTPKVALEGYQGDKTAAELISTHQVTSGQISTWKNRLLEGAQRLFEPGQAQ